MTQSGSLSQVTECPYKTLRIGLPICPLSSGERVRVRGSPLP